MFTIGKFKDLVEELGFRSAVLYTLSRALRLFGKSNRLIHYHLVAQPVDRRLLPARRGASIQVERISSRDGRLHALELDDEVLAYREDQNAVCFAAFKEGAIVGCLWFCPGPYEEDEVRCRYVPLPADKAVWDFGIYILPDYRSSLAFARLWDVANAYLREQGIRWSLSRILGYNAQSLRSHRALGAETLGTATFLVLGSLQLMVCSMAPRVHLSFRQADRPQILVHSPSCSVTSEAAPAKQETAT